MDTLNGLPLPAPAVVPTLDPAFRPAVLAVRAFAARVSEAGGGVPVRLALEQADGSVFRFDLAVLPAGHPDEAGNVAFVERYVKFLLWSRGGWRLHVDAPAALVDALEAHYRETATGRFDADLVASRMFDHPLTITRTAALPDERSVTRPLGRHLEGCRIGFDLGGSDRKVAAVIDGEVVFSEETVWDPYHKPDPQYHFDGIMDSLQKAAEHLPRVDAIGGSAAGVYVNNRVKAGSLFRGVAQDLFDQRVKDLFLEVRRAWKGVPLEVVNDGEVTALAGSMSLGKNAILGIALGTSTAAGYVTADGNITSWLNELAFVPVAYNPDAPADEWSGDFGVGSQYLSQQAVGRLAPLAGIETPADMGLPDKLKVVQRLRAEGHDGARKIYETVGVY
ncbi:MAG TPA: hypothetical protein VMF13_04485, partial [Luteitalea sp.]|nr:hypothetical protein [Luteitalea sp.]